MIRAVAVGALLTAGVVALLDSQSAAGAAYAAVCLTVYGIAAWIVTGRVGFSHPFDRFGPANWITLGRVSLLATVAGLVAEPPTATVAWTALGGAVLLVVLDGLDGWVARRSRLVSPFGGRFDMETDAAAILVLSLLVWRHDKAGVWVVGCGLMRYLFVAAGWMLPWMAAPLRSTFRGKTVAVAQLVGLGLALCPLVARSASVRLAAVTLAALVWSFAIDVAWLWRGRARASLTST